MFSASAANVNAKLMRARIEAALEGTHDRCCDSGRVPVHAHHAAQRLEPERIAQPGEQFRRAVVVENTLGNRGAQHRHALGKPRRHTPAMQRQVGDSGALHNSIMNQILQTFAPSMRGSRWKFVDNIEMSGSLRMMRHPAPPGIDPAVHQLILTAIHDKRLLRFFYKGEPRLVEPQDYGIQKNTVNLFTYQIGGQSSSGPLPDWGNLPSRPCRKWSCWSKHSQEAAPCLRKDIRSGTCCLPE